MLPMHQVKLSPLRRTQRGQDRATRSGSHARASTDRQTVFLTDQNFRTADSTSKVETVEHKAGDVAWGTPIEHSEQNLCNEPFEAMAVEVKWRTTKLA